MLKTLIVFSVVATTTAQVTLEGTFKPYAGTEVNSTFRDGNVRVSTVPGNQSLLLLFWSFSVTSGNDQIIQECATPNPATPNSCGIHVHTGSTCDVVSQVGSHFWLPTSATDPWLTTYWKQNYGSLTVTAGYDVLQATGRAVVLHKRDGSRWACAVVRDPTNSYPEQGGGMIDASQFSLDSTWHMSKVSCLRAMYFVHVFLCYCIFFAGIGAMVSRLVPKIKWMHVWFGRFYIIVMLLNTFTSTLIHNTGLPVNTVYLFCVIMICISIGWPIIMVYQKNMNSQAMQRVQASLVKGPFEGDLETLIYQEKGKIANGRSFKERMFSKKAAHGFLMFISWGNIAGRIFASNQSGDFTCHTYPVYKPVAAAYGPTIAMDLKGKPLQLVPTIDPRYSRLPWASMGEVGWSFMIDTVYLVLALVVGSLIAYSAAKKVHNNGHTKITELPVSSGEKE